MLTETMQCYSKTRQLVNRRKPQAFGRADAAPRGLPPSWIGGQIKLTCGLCRHIVSAWKHCVDTPNYTGPRYEQIKHGN